MSIREFAKSVGFDISGKLKRKPDECLNGIKYQVWVDEAGNEYAKCEKGYCIVTNDGGVI